MNKPTLSSSTECKCLCHAGFPWQEINGECEHCKPDTTTQGDDIDKNNLINEKERKTKIQTTGVSIHSEKDGNKLDTTLDTSFTALDSNTDSKKTYPTGDDSMKEKIEEILADKYGMIALETVEALLALFQSQESKTFERVREKAEDIKVIDWLDNGDGLILRKDVIAILETEQKGKSNE